MNPLGFIQKTAIEFTNMARSRYTELDYIHFILSKSIPAMPDNTNWILQRLMGNNAPLNLLQLDQIFRRIADDPRPLGVILQLRGMQMPMADLQSLRDSVLRLRESGKRVIFYASDYSLADYYLASAGDDILLQPGGNVSTMGLHRQMLFMKESLDAVGVQVDSVAITPFKGAADTFTLNEPSDEGRQQMNWLLDSIYNTMINDIASTRKLKHDDVKKMVDTAPHLDHSALEHGYVDAIMNVEGLKTYLGAEHLVLWEHANGMIYERTPKFGEKYITVLYANGMIIDGTSANPPAQPPIPIPFLGNNRIGDLTVVQQIRNIIRDQNCVGVVFYVDSNGGSATASEAMASALDELAKTRPVVVYMGNVAASGGYYISTPAHWIVAQASTITGSIGVINAKVVNNDLLKKLRFNPVEFMRGENADFTTSKAPFTPEQRQKMRDGIENIYEQFIARVADSREMSRDAVDAIAGGRVWTGEQALSNGLIDQVGGLYEAVEKARELVGNQEMPVTLFQGSGKPLGVQLAEQANPAAILTYMQENLQSIACGNAQFLMPFEFND